MHKKPVPSRLSSPAQRVSYLVARLGFSWRVYVASPPSPDCKPPPFNLNLFLASQMNYDTPLSTTATTTASLPLRTQLRRGFADMGSRSYSSAKSIGFVGPKYARTECCIEGLRAKNDWKNAVSAGCITGGVLGAKAGPQAAALGCGGFAAFSTAIEWYLGLEGEEKSSDGLQ